MRSRGSQLVSCNSDWVSIVEAAYDDEPDLQRWGAHVYERCAGLVRGCETSGFHLLRHDNRGRFTDLPMQAGHIPPLDWCGSWLDEYGVTPQFFRALYYPVPIVMTFGDLRVASAHNPSLDRFCADFGIGDAMAVVVHPEPGSVLMFHLNTPEGITLGAETRRRLTWLGLHLEAAARLRLRPESLRAVLGPEGRLEHLTPGAPPKATLVDAAARITAAKRERAAGADALATWQALVAGELSVVERTIGTRRHYFFFDNPPHRQPLQALTPGEQDVVGAVSRGQSNKAVAYALGLSESAVSLRLGRASEKLGLATRMDLVRLAAVLTRDPRAHFVETTLGSSEREVLELLARGLSNEEIARLRSRSARTIANQIASLLRKTGASSRRELAMHASRA